MRRLLFLSAGLAAGCIDVPAYTGPDAPPLDGSPSDGALPGITSVFAHAEAQTAAVGETVLEYAGEVRDNNGAWDGTTFVAPKANQYLICASTSMSLATSFANLVVRIRVGDEPAVDRRIGRGLGVVKGCIALDLAAGTRIELVASQGLNDNVFGFSRESSWISIDVVQNDGIWAGAAGLAGMVTGKQVVPLQSWQGQWESDQCKLGPGPFLVCGATGYVGNMSLGVNVYAQARRLLPLADAANDGFTAGCRTIIPVLGPSAIAQNAALVAYSNSSNSPPADPPSNWISCQALTNGDWYAYAEGSNAVGSVSSSMSQPLSFPADHVGGNTGPPQQFNGQAFGISRGGGEALVCASFDAGMTPLVLTAVVEGSSSPPIELARGSGRIHGCTVIGLSTSQSLSLELRGVGDAMTTVAADQAAAWTIVKIH